MIRDGLFANTCSPKRKFHPSVHTFLCLFQWKKLLLEPEGFGEKFNAKDFTLPSVQKSMYTWMNFEFHRTRLFPRIYHELKQADIGSVIFRPV
jgi:hypothetical protein